MSVLVSTLLSALIPVGVEGAKQYITTKVGRVKATTVEEQLEIEKIINNLLLVFPPSLQSSF